MTKVNEVYKCNVCGNVVEMVHEGVGELVCCEQPMELQAEKVEDEGMEKHVPVIEENKVKVGSVSHPMEEDHYIEWIEVISDGKVCKKFLKPGEVPEKEFGGNIQTARAYCNKHGLWKST